MNWHIQRLDCSVRNRKVETMFSVVFLHDIISASRKFLAATLSYTDFIVYGIKGSVYEYRKTYVMNRRVARYQKFAITRSIKLGSVQAATVIRVQQGLIITTGAHWMSVVLCKTKQLQRDMTNNNTGGNFAINVSSLLKLLPTRQCTYSATLTLV